MKGKQYKSKETFGHSPVLCNSKSDLDLPALWNFLTSRFTPEFLNLWAQIFWETRLLLLK